MIPSKTNYPVEIDTDDNLFYVNDSLRVRLLEDYKIGDKSIHVEGDKSVIDKFPDTGLITLTEQCSDLEDRAISFYYSSFDKTNNVISGLELLPEFTDVNKPKRITNVTMNVMDKHHNNLKDALIAIQKFCGEKGTEDLEPFGETLEGRINFLRRIVLQPKAWFTSDIRTGTVPLTIEFENMSFRLGTDGTEDEVTVTWNFGDRSSSTISLTSLISADSLVPDSAVDVLVRDTDSGKIKKVYYEPGNYDVSLTVENNFGSDTVTFEKYISARTKAPNLAIINFIENVSNQSSTPGDPPNGPFETYPTIRSPINSLININVAEGENPNTPGYSYAGEALDSNDNPIDPIVTWTWELGDDLTHPSSRETNASFSVGGIYDLKLRVDTELGAFRITSYPNTIDVVENVNLWHWIFDNNGVTARAYEYGLISETFKTANAPSLTVTRNDDFLTGENNEEQQKKEFKKNVGFAPTSNTSSGLGGSALLYWASGRAQSDPTSSEKINIVEFNGFSGVYLTKTPITRRWNWANLNSPQYSYFLFGGVSSYPANSSPTNQNKQTLNLLDLSISSEGLISSNYLNGSQELMQNVSAYNNDGESIYGNFSVYRTAWKDNTGYILRNDGVGPFFRIKSFYRTEGTVGVPLLNIRKMQDIQGPTKLEGELVSMSTGIYFLNNSGSVSKFTPTTSTWSTGGPGVNSLLYRNLQDTSVSGFDDVSNTLLIASDSDKRAYLSFDYSNNAFLKFNETDLTFSTLGSRPSGNQWVLGIY